MIARRAVAAMALAALGAGCVTSEAVTRSPDPAGDRSPVDATGAAGPVPSPSPSPSPTPSPSPSPEADLPDPDEAIPLRAGPLADALEATAADNRAAIARWSQDGGTSAWPPPQDVELLALYEQRILRELARRPKLAERVLARLTRRTAAEARNNVRAGRALFEHFRPVEEVPDFRIRKPEPADTLLEYFREAEERFEVDWEVLAAIMLVETRMGRIRSSSSAGAQGPMQFLPSTWAAYGLGGDVRDPHDAVLGAANYLRASGAPGDYRRALHAYNPVEAYVTAVWRYARTMTRFPEAYYAYYNWQVFVRTVDGDVRLSGPGL